MAALEKQLHLTAEPAGSAGSRQVNTSAEFKKRSAFVVFLAIGVIGALVVIWEARVIFLVLFAGCLGALVLATLTSLFQRTLRIPWPFAFAFLLVSLVAIFGVAMWLRGPALAEQFGELQADLPEAARRLYSNLGESNWEGGS